MGKSSSSREPPPAGGLWDRPLAEAPLAFVDVEMSGLDVSTDRVLQICVERVVGGEVVDGLNSLVRPEERVELRSDIHGITWPRLKEAPLFADLEARVCALLDGAIFVAHAARYDVAFISAEMARRDGELVRRHYLDTLALARRAFTLKKHNLVSLCEALEISYETPHRAESDVAAMRAVFDRIVAVLKPSTARDLWNARAGQLQVNPEHVALAQRVANSGKAVLIRYRPSSKPLQELHFRVTEVRPKLDPPLVLGYLLSTRGRRELRADRILAIDETDS